MTTPPEQRERPALVRLLGHGWHVNNERPVVRWDDDGCPWVLSYGGTPRAEIKCKPGTWEPAPPPPLDAPYQPKVGDVVVPVKPSVLLVEHISPNALYSVSTHTHPKCEPGTHYIFKPEDLRPATAAERLAAGPPPPLDGARDLEQRGGVDGHARSEGYGSGYRSPSSTESAEIGRVGAIEGPAHAAPSQPPFDEAACRAAFESMYAPGELTRFNDEYLGPWRAGEWRGYLRAARTAHARVAEVTKERDIARQSVNLMIDARVEVEGLLRKERDEARAALAKAESEREGAEAGRAEVVWMLRACLSLSPRCEDCTSPAGVEWTRKARAIVAAFDSKTPPGWRPEVGDAIEHLNEPGSICVVTRPDALVAYYLKGACKVTFIVGGSWRYLRPATPSSSPPR